MTRSMSKTVCRRACAALTVVILWAPGAHAYEQWSQNGGDATNCGTCHGDFRNADYTSPSDGMNWGNLHNLHRSTMLSGDCDVCHSGSSRFPVLIDVSNGGDGLAGISCMGCHGRAADDTPENPEFPNGAGAGLRQHHHNAGATVCADCHDDADPANYVPVGEHVLPEYYANPGNNHPAMPQSPCNGSGTEDFAGSADGLDNDGDLDYDATDADCSTPVRETTWGRIRASYR